MNLSLKVLIDMSRTHQDMQLLNSLAKRQNDRVKEVLSDIEEAIFRPEVCHVLTSIYPLKMHYTKEEFLKAKEGFPP